MKKSRFSDLQFGWFRPEDFKRVISTLSKSDDPRSFVIVGGQSVVAWCLVLGIDVSRGESEIPPMTQDLDLLSPIRHAKWLAKELDADLYLPDQGDATPNAAKLIISNYDGSKKLEIDVMKYVYGINSNEEIHKWAAELEFDGDKMFVLHPIFVLKSRIANLWGLPEKRTPDGVAQAKIAVEIIAKYIFDQIQDPAKAVQTVKKVAEIASSKEGAHCFVKYGIDPMAPLAEWFQTVPSHKQFIWPSIMKMVERQREKALAKEEGVIHMSVEERQLLRLQKSESTAPAEGLNDATSSGEHRQTDSFKL